jgi:hypothetical protein
MEEIQPYALIIKTAQPPPPPYSEPQAEIAMIHGTRQKSSF